MKKVLSLIIVLLFVCADVNAATVAYWQFDDNEPGTVTSAGQRVVDSSGNGRDLYAGTGTSLPTFAESNILYGAGAAISLTGGDDELIFEAGHIFGDGGSAAGSYLDFTGFDSFTIEAMVRIPVGTSSTAVTAITNKYSTGVNYPSIYLRFESSTSLRFSIKDVANVGPTCTVTIPNCYDGNWHHVAAVRNLATFEVIVYLDYVEVGRATDSSSNTFVDTAAKWYVGAMGGSSTREFIGSIDFIRISNTALLPADFIQVSPLLASNPSPADNAYNIAIPSVTLGWTPASGTGVTVSSQVVQVATDSEFANIIQTFNLNGTANSATLTPVVNNRKYFWRVNSSGTDNGSPFSQTGLTWSFQTVDAYTTVAGYWKFDNQAPGTSMDVNGQVIDSSGNNRDLLVLGEPVQEFGNAIYGNPYAIYGSGASFEGYQDNQLILIPGYPFGGGSDIAGGAIAIPVGGSLTIEAVVKLDAGLTNYNAIASYNPSIKDTQWYGANMPQWWFRISNAGIPQFYVRSAPSVNGAANGTTNLYDGQWHHIAAVKDGSAGKIRVYVDYTLEKEANDVTGEINPTGNMVIAGFYNTESRNFDGNIDFVKVTRAALSPSGFVQTFALPTNPNPVNGATGVPINYTFSWTPIAGATITSQTVKVATDQYMQNIVKTVTASGNSAAITGLENNTTYYWRVDTVGSDGGGAFNRQGTIWSFSTPACLVTVEMGNLFNEDCIIDFKDFAIMANNWLLSEFE